MALAAAGISVPQEASACGGTFCDAFTPGMQVEQTAEAILFVSDGDYVEAHVQIQYDGAKADQFAWMVPVPAVPEIEVGSWRLVQTVFNATQPVYSFENNYLCEPETTGVGFIQEPDGGGVSNEGGVGPDVVAQDVVGAFEYVVLQGGDSSTINTWLIDNDYATDEAAPEILDEYIAEGSVFVAFRLRHGAEVEDIHPVVIRYPGTEPCIPIRLTRIAARENMDITALFLGDDRVVPTNYRHVQLNTLKVSWSDLGLNYADVVAMAVDEPEANGRAFVTEYAGTSEIVDAEPLDTSAYDSGAFADIAIVDVVNTLQAQGLASCDTDGCTYQHELVPSLLHEFIPVPAGLEDGAFYSCLSCYAQLIDVDAWDEAAFMAAYSERVVDPLRHGEELLEMWPYLTRLYTRMSPHEMTTDPMFAEVEGLDNVAARHGARQELGCCTTMMRLPGGRLVNLDSFEWPTFGDMPWAERIEEYAPGGGAPITLVDNTEVIDTLLDAWNNEHACDEETGGATDDTGGGPATSTGGPGGEGTDAGTVTSGTGPGTMTSEIDDGGADSGCGCTSGSSGSSTPWFLMLFGLGLGAMRRRGA